MNKNIMIFILILIIVFIGFGIYFIQKINISEKVFLCGDVTLEEFKSDITNGFVLEFQSDNLVEAFLYSEAYDDPNFTNYIYEKVGFNKYSITSLENATFKITNEHNLLLTTNSGYKPFCVEILKSEYEQIKVIADRMETALRWPLTYWKISYDDILTGNAYQQFTNAVDPYKTCVVVGLSFHKNKGSIYYLDDEMDYGIFSLFPRSLIMNGTKAHLGTRELSMVSGINDYQYNECGYVYDEYKIQDQSVVNIEEDKKYYFLFMIFNTEIDKTYDLIYKELVTNEITQIGSVPVNR